VEVIRLSAQAGEQGTLRQDVRGAGAGHVAGFDDTGQRAFRSAADGFGLPTAKDDIRIGQEAGGALTR